MVFNTEEEEVRNNHLARQQAIRQARFLKVSGDGVVKVVRRVENAEENKNLDLSNCQLKQIPDAIYFMIEKRNMEVTACNLSSNIITKIPPKFPTSFNLITELNLSYNKMSTLPEEVSSCSQLETVDISHNSFISLPNCLLNLPKIIKINAKKNFIADIEVELINTCETLEYVNLQENPLSRDFHDNLSAIANIRILVTPREMEEWEDLSI